MSDSRTRPTLRERRTDAGLSREKLARLADTSTSTIVRIEAGHVPGAALLGRIARALGVSVDELLPEDEPNGERVA